MVEHNFHVLKIFDCLFGVVRLFVQKKKLSQQPFCIFQTNFYDLKKPDKFFFILPKDKCTIRNGISQQKLPFEYLR
jgi:hypothetical protein